MGVHEPYTRGPVLALGITAQHLSLVFGFVVQVASVLEAVPVEVVHLVDDLRLDQLVRRQEQPARTSPSITDSGANFARNLSS